MTNDSENVQDAEKAWGERDHRKVVSRSSFMAGRASRDADVAELRKQLTEAREQGENHYRNALEWKSRAAEAQATIDKIDRWFNDLGDTPCPNGEALARILDAAPSSTGGGDKQPDMRGADLSKHKSSIGWVPVEPQQTLQHHAHVVPPGGEDMTMWIECRECECEWGWTRYSREANEKLDAMAAEHNERAVEPQQKEDR